MFDYVMRTTEKIILELNEKEKHAFAADFAKKLTEAGVEVSKLYIPDSFNKEKFAGVEIDFSEHDRRVTKEHISENEALQKQIEDLDRQNTDIQNSNMKLYNNSKDEIRKLKDKIKSLQEDNSKYETANSLYKNELEECECANERLNRKILELEIEIQRLREKCGEASEDTDKSCASNDVPDYEKLCRELQDQHQQDCILINNLNVTIDKLVDRYANLRKNMGMD